LAHLRTHAPLFWPSQSLRLAPLGPSGRVESASRAPPNCCWGSNYHSVSNLMSTISDGMNLAHIHNYKDLSPALHAQRAPTTEQDIISCCCQKQTLHPCNGYRHQDLKTIPSHHLVAPHTQICCWGNNTHLSVGSSHHDVTVIPLRLSTLTGFACSTPLRAPTTEPAQVVLTVNSLTILPLVTNQTLRQSSPQLLPQSPHFLKTPLNTPFVQRMAPMTDAAQGYSSTCGKPTCAPQTPNTGTCINNND